MYNFELSSQIKQNFSEGTTLEKYLDVKQLVAWPIFNWCTTCTQFFFFPHNTILCPFVKSIIRTKFAKWKTENTHQVFYQNFEKWTKLVWGYLWTIIQSKVPRELQYMSILLALAYHDKAMFETFRQVEQLHHQPLNSFFR